MPPRKRLRPSQPASASPVSQVKTPTPAEDSSPPDQLDLVDQWTDEEETALFKALMHWKPTGIHKHFHLIALHEELLNGGHIHPRNEHTKPAGIWQKLGTLYDLGVLDEREDARQLEKMKVAHSDSAEETTSDEADDDPYSEAGNKIENEDFSLPGDDFAARKWARRLATGRDAPDDSPPLLPDLNMADDPPVRFTPSFSIEPSETATPTSRKRRTKPGMAAAKVGTTASSTRRSTRQAESGADDGDEDAGDDGEEQNSEEEEDHSQQGTPARPGTRNAKETRAPASQKAQTRSRGRAK